MKSLVLAAFLGLANIAAAAPLSIDLQSDKPLLSAGKPETVVLRLGLKAEPVTGSRAPLNQALVLDRSGSMQGGKIARLREAARHAIMRLRADDVLSIVAFDSQVSVLRHAAKVRDGQDALRAIDSLEADGSTALYAGTEAGLKELQEFQGKNRVSRMILISDGMANIGPSSPTELAELGREAGRRGIPITTFGLGHDYAEDLMTRLAMASDGNHSFIADEGSLAKYFDKEMGEALSVAVRDLVIEITLGKGVRYKGSLDRDLQAEGRILRWKLSQIPGGVEKRLMVEVEAPSLAEGDIADIASARVAYADASGKGQSALMRSVSAKGAPAEKALVTVNAPVAADAALARANQKRDEAIRLKDAGKSKEANDMLMENAVSLRAAEKATGISGLGAAASSYAGEAEAISAPSADWNVERKKLKARSHSETTQQSY